MRSPISAGSRRGCGAMPTSSTSSAGCARTTRGSRPTSVPASTVSTCTACAPRCRRCWRISRRSIPKARAARAHTLCLLRSVRRRRPAVRLCGRIRGRRLLRARRCHPAARAAPAAGRRYASRDGRVAADDYFFAEQNARLVRNAEEYYRTMFRGRAESWNLRDQHMAETLRELVTVSRAHARQSTRRRLGAQLASRRCPRHGDGRGRRAERRPARAGALRCRSGAGRIHDVHAAR